MWLVEEGKSPLGGACDKRVDLLVLLLIGFVCG